MFRKTNLYNKGEKKDVGIKYALLYRKGWKISDASQEFEEDESPEECLLREVKEETGLTLTSYQYRAMVTFVSGSGVTEYMSLFTADGFEGEQIPCNEGDLEWVEISLIDKLNLWEGDLIFHRLLLERDTFFSLKLVYDGHDKLVYAALDGKPIGLQGQRL